MAADAGAPPWTEAAAFRVLGWRLGGRYAAWMAEDIRSGRNLRWRLVSCGVMVVGTQLLVRGAFTARGVPSAPWWAPVGGGVIGLVLGMALVRRQGADRRIARTLRSQGLLADGRPDPSPSFWGRMDNYGIAAVQLASISFLGLVAGYVPIRLVPVPDGRCVPPSAADVAGIRDQLRPGVRVVGLRSVRHAGVAYVSGVGPDGAVATWVGYDALDDVKLPLPNAASLVPGTGISSSSPVRPEVADAIAKAEGCARQAAAQGDGPSLLVAPPVADVAPGTMRLQGAVETSYDGLTASCGDGSAVVQLGASAGVLLVRGAVVDVSLPTGVFRGRLGFVDGGRVTVSGSLAPSYGPPTPRLGVTASVPCS